MARSIVALAIILFPRGFAQTTSPPEGPSRAVAESAVAIALDHLQRHGTNLVQHGWTLAHGGTNAMLEEITGETKFRLTVSFAREPLLIRSGGWVKSPEQTEFLNRPYSMLAEAIRIPAFREALASTGDIDLRGESFRIDSYDSTDPNYSTEGEYDAAKNKDNGDMATNASLLDSVGSGALLVFGRLAVGAEGIVTLGSSGVIGSKPWHSSGQTGIEPGWLITRTDIQSRDVPPPYDTAASADSVRNEIRLDSGDHLLKGDLFLSGAGKLIVIGNARLYVTGRISLTGNSHFEIQPGASLELFVGGDTAYFGGQGIRNLTAKPENFIYWGLKTNTYLALAFSGPFIGTIYAPQAQITLGYGDNINEIRGAVVGGSVRLNGHLNFHYDEALPRLGPQIWALGQTTHPPRVPSGIRVAVP